MGADALRRWLAEYLSWMVWALLALWTPPVALTIAVNLGVVTDGRSGFARLTDMPFALTLMQLALMAASLPGLPGRRRWAWRMQLAATAAWAGAVAWQMQSGVRLFGLRTLRSRETLMAIALLSIYGVIVLSIRRRFAESPAVTRSTSRG